MLKEPNLQIAEGSCEYAQAVVNDEKERFQTPVYSLDPHWSALDRCCIINCPTSGKGYFIYSNNPRIDIVLQGLTCEFCADWGEHVGSSGLHYVEIPSKSWQRALAVQGLWGLDHPEVDFDTSIVSLLRSLVCVCSFLVKSQRNGRETMIETG